MKSLIFSLAIVTLLFYTVGYLACVKDKCKDVVCRNEGICVDGTCSCAWGYEGSSCQQKWADKFTGIWQVTDKYSRDTNSHSYNILVNPYAAYPDTFIINDFTDSISVKCARSEFLKFIFLPGQKADTFFTLQEGYGILDPAAGNISGAYTFLKRTIIDDSTTKDTTITAKFTWRR